MIYLVEYDRSKSQLVSCDEFEERDLPEVEKKRLTLELKLNDQNLRHEVVILEANSRAALKETHGRYFATLDELAHRMSI